ncbi:MAG: energy transducer TonB, partial [Bacteroidota bacterium]
KGMFLQLGLVIALGLSWMAFEWRTYEGGVIDLGQLDAIIEDEEMLVTNRETPPPPPPPPAPVEVFKIVDNKIDIVELDLISTEIDDDAAVEIMEVEAVEEVFNFVNVENKPLFPGCEDLATEEERFNCFNTKTRQFIGKNFEFPEMARQMGIQGKVWVSFIIEKDGRITDVTVDRGVDKLLDEEAVRVVKLFPKMTPAKVGGRAVRMRYSLPINARLQ